MQVSPVLASHCVRQVMLDRTLTVSINVRFQVLDNQIKGSELADNVIDVPVFDKVD